MSVLIKGMETPEKCGSCDLFHAELPMHCTVVKGHKTVGAPYGMPRPDWCPLVEVPEPHGELIDRDALNASIKELRKIKPLYKLNEFWELEGTEIMNLIMGSQTVIEAEGSENHDD